MKRRPISQQRFTSEEKIKLEWASTTDPPQDQLAWQHGPSPLCLSGGFGCIAAGTKILDVRFQKEIPVEWYVENGVGPVVAAWTGSHFEPAWASIPWIKGYETLYRIVTQLGRSIVVTDKHRFLMADGSWQSLSSGLQIGSPLHGFDASLLRSTSDSAQLAHGEDGPHSMRTLEDSQGGYQAYCRSCGGLLRPSQDTYQEPSQPQSDAQKRSGLFPSPQGVQQIGPNDNLLTQPYRRSNPCASLPVAPLSSASGAYGSAGIVALARDALAGLDVLRSLGMFSRKEPKLESLETTSTALSDSWSDRITAIEDLGSGLFYDLHVPFYQNYVAEGLVHHNSGKSVALCRKAQFLSDLFPHNRGVIARKQWTTLKDTTMSTFFKILPASAYDEKLGGRRADSEKYLRLAASQSEILWLHLDQDDIDKVIRGLEINWFLLDQAEEMGEEVFATLLTRLGRWDKAQVPDYMLDPEYLQRTYGVSEWPWRNPAGRAIVPTYAMIACNPDHEMHWIWRRFHEESPDYQSIYKKQGYQMLTMRSDENRFLPKQNLEEMLRADESFQRRFVRGEWGIPEGQIHSITKDSIIEATPELVKWLVRSFPLARTMDHGDASPTTCGWFATDQDGNVFCFAEYYQGNKLISEHRAAMRSIEEAICRASGVEKLRHNYQLADPSIFYKTMQKYGGRASVADDYLDRSSAHGFRAEDAIAWDAADNDELGTRNLINEYLRPQGSGEFKDGKEEPRVHPITKELGFWPRLFFLKKSESWPHGAERVIIETRNQRRERIGMEMGRPSFSDERDKGITDHAYDFLRYFIASRAGKAQVPQKLYGKYSFLGWRDMGREFKRKGGWRKAMEGARA